MAPEDIRALFGVDLEAAERFLQALNLHPDLKRDLLENDFFDYFHELVYTRLSDPSLAGALLDDLTGSAELRAALKGNGGLVGAWEVLIASSALRKIEENLRSVSIQIDKHPAKIPDFKLKLASITEVERQKLLSRIDVFFGFKPGRAREDILAIPKGTRPVPSDYLTSSYISEHVTKFDKEGGAFLVVKSWIEGGRYNTFPPNKFAMLKSDMKKALDDYKASDDISVLEVALGYNTGELVGLQNELYVFYPTSSQYTFKMPDGNEIGANTLWEPGGVTSGGRKEAIMEGLTDPNEVIVHNKDINHLIRQFDYEKL